MAARLEGAIGELRCADMTYVTAYLGNPEPMVSPSVPSPPVSCAFVRPLASMIE